MELLADSMHLPKPHGWSGSLYGTCTRLLISAVLSLLLLTLRPLLHFEPEQVCFWAADRLCVIPILLVEGIAACIKSIYLILAFILLP